MTEYFDVYDKNFCKTGKIIERGGKLATGEYHLAVDVILYNSRRQVLLQKRAENKNYCPGFWGLTGGAANAGEDSLTAIIRETKEEVGVVLKPEKVKFFCRQNGEDAALFVDIFTAECNLPVSEMKMQVEEVGEIKWCSGAEFEKLAESGCFMPALIQAVRKYFAEN